MHELDLYGVGRRIRKQRECLKLTREEASELLDISTKFFYDIELGIKGMSLKTLLNISDTLKLSTDYILKGENEPDENDINNVLNMLKTCDEKKLKTAEELLRVYLSS